MNLLTQHLLPHRLVALLAHLSANCKIKWVKNFLINYFIKRYPVKMHEAIVTDPFVYACYNDFFTRRLKPECRPIAANSNAIVSPADGLIAQIGAIEAGKIMQAKGRFYSALELLGGDQALAAEFRHGSFATVYLAPKDYHRVHMPFSGTLTQMIYVPGDLFSVNTFAAENIPNLFARNERVVSIFNTEAGKMAVVLVGAMIVGSIETAWAGVITPPHAQKLQRWNYDQSLTLNKGDDLGLFRLGSTVIVLLANEEVSWQKLAGVDINMGAEIGVITS